MTIMLQFHKIGTWFFEVAKRVERINGDDPSLRATIGGPPDEAIGITTEMTAQPDRSNWQRAEQNLVRARHGH